MSLSNIPLISFGGLASGLDTNAIIQSLVAVEHIPIDLMIDQKSGYESKISAFENFESLLETLQSAADDLKDDQDFNVFTTSVSSEGILTATASSSAVEGSYGIEVLQLASFEQHASDERYAAKGTVIGTGTITITVGSTSPTAYDITIDSDHNTLEGIVSAINNANAGVTATIVNDGADPDKPYRLVLTGDDTGVEAQFSVDTSGLSGPETLTFTEGNELQTAADAHIKLNGLDVYRSTNTVKNASPGLTLNLLSTTPTGQPVTLTVSRDLDAVKGKITNFVDAYNDVVDFINTQNTYTEGQGGGVLMGESLLQRAQERIQAILLPGWNGDPNAPEIQTLAQIGVDFENDGTLVVTDSELTAALSEHFEDVKNLFSQDGGGTPEGMADGLENLLDDYTQAGGFLDTMKESLQSHVDDLADQIEKAETRLDDYEASLVAKFAALESLMSGLQTQQAYLSQAIFGYSTT